MAVCCEILYDDTSETSWVDDNGETCFWQSTIVSKMGLGGYGVSRRCGNFGGKLGPDGHLSGRITRLGYEGYGVRRGGSYLRVGTHPVGKITRLGYEGYGVRRATFTAKTAEVVTPPITTPPPTVPPPIGGGVGHRPPPHPRGHYSPNALGRLRTTREEIPEEEIVLPEVAPEPEPQKPKLTAPVLQPLPIDFGKGRSAIIGIKRELERQQQELLADDEEAIIALILAALTNR